MIDTSKREKSLAKLIREKNRAVNRAPDGRLRVSGDHGRTKYYVVYDKGDSSGHYLSREQRKLAKQLAQKDYDRRILRAAEEELRAWQELAKFFPSVTVEELFDTLSPARRSLVSPILPTDEEFRRQWEAVKYKPGWFKPDAKEFYTDRRERVRSKSEQLIANLLNRLNIPYRYEYPVKITVEGREELWRPDFMILDVRHRKEFFLEHFGRMDDPTYARQTYEKMRIYEENGLWEGHGMYYSFEAEGAPVDMRLVEMKLLRILREGR